MKSILKINILYLVLILLFSCKNASNTASNTSTPPDHGHQHTEVAHGHEHGDHEQDPHDHGAPSETSDNHEEDAIHLTQRQVEAIGLELGELSSIKISDYIKASGTLGLPPDAYSTVSSKSNGFIKNAKKYVEGSAIKKGAIIAFLENPALIEKQESYLSISAELTYLRQEYDRQKTLLDQQAGVQKTVQSLFSQLEMKRAKKLGLEKYLKYVGIQTSDVMNGTFVQRIPIIAPMSGFITSIDMHNGMYVTPQRQLVEIVSDHHLHLELNVFEQDIANIEEDQKITYTIPALGDEIFQGEVHVIGKEFDPQNKTIRIHGHPEGKKPKFIKDLFLNAKIWLNDKKVTALPSEAVMKEGDTNLIYYTLSDLSGSKDSKKAIEFNKLRVIPGSTDNGYIAIKMLDPLPQGARIVTKGSYFIYAQSKYGEAVHEH